MSILSRFAHLKRRFSLSLHIVDASISVDVGTNAQRYAMGVSVGPGFFTLNRNGDIARFYGRDLSSHLPERIRDFYYGRDFGDTAPIRQERLDYERACEREAMLSGIYSSAEEDAPPTLRYA